MGSYDSFFEAAQVKSVEEAVEIVYGNMKARGLVTFRGRECLTGYSYREVYDWDMYFENIFLSYLEPCKYARNGVESFLETISANGFVARTAGYVHDRTRQQFKPFLAQMAWLYIRDTDNHRWITEKYYTALVDSVDYWFWYQDIDKNGLCMWNSADHSGMDNQDRRAGVVDQFSVEGVDLNCYLVRELDALAIIAESLSKDEDVASFRARAQALRQAIREILWHEEDGFFYDRDERSGETVKVKSCVAFMTLWAGVASKEQADRLVKEHLLNEDEFWLAYPVATWSKDEPDYYQGRKANECSWMGATWIPTNYMIFHGLLDYGYVEAAKHLAYKSFEMVTGEDEMREYYNGETGTGEGLNPFWGWSTLAYVMPLEYELAYNPSALVKEELQRLLKN